MCPRVIYHLSKSGTNAIYCVEKTRMSFRSSRFESDPRDVHDQLRQLRDELDAAMGGGAYGGSNTTVASELHALRCELDRMRRAIAELWHVPPAQASKCAPAATCTHTASAAAPYPPFPPYPPYPPVPSFPPYPPYPPNCGCCAPAPCGCNKCRPAESKSHVVHTRETPDVPSSSSNSSSSSSSSSSSWRREDLYRPLGPKTSSSSQFVRNDPR
jgi:hypothetical protein